MSVEPDRDAMREFIGELTKRGITAVVAATGEVMVRSAQSTKAECKFARTVLTSAQSAGLVAIDIAGSVAVSKAGRQWLKRQLTAPLGDPYRAQHQEQRIEQALVPGQSVLVNDSESPLAWLRRRHDASGRPILSDAQYLAGERLRADFTLALMQPRTTANWSGLVQASGRNSRGGPGGGVELRDTVIRAKVRVNAALSAVGPEFASVLADVCCHLKGLEAVEAAAGWPRRSGKVVLIMALSALARHYGLATNPAPVSTGAAAIRHWGTADYRPSLTPTG